MVKYLVENLEVYSCRYEVRADSPEQALEKFESGDFSEFAEVQSLRSFVESVEDQERKVEPLNPPGYYIVIAPLELTPNRPLFWHDDRGWIPEIQEATQYAELRFNEALPDYKGEEGQYLFIKTNG